MKLASWNVNGLRSVHGKGFLDWFADERADVIALQEIKARPEQLAEELLHPQGYHSFWNPAEKPGYSGVSLFTKKEPLDVFFGVGHPEADREGRVISAVYPDFVLVNAYFPNSQRDHARLPFKLEFCEAMAGHLGKWVRKGKHVVLCGDLNIAHEEIDLKNPKSNQQNAGFLPEERAWLTGFLRSGYVDPFRKRNPKLASYTWWSYRPGVREKNVGWRLDYHLVNAEFEDRVKNTEHRCAITGSDHCPVILTLR